MKYYLGPWRWVGGDEPHYAAPSTAVGCIDLRTLPDQGIPNTPTLGCLCWTNGDPLPGEYTLLGDGDCREIKANRKTKAAFHSLLRYTPDGDTLADMILDTLVGGSDPDGLSAARPIIPGLDGWMDLHMAGHGRVKGLRFEWGRTPHKSKVKHALRSQFAALMDDAGKGKLRDSQHHLRVLDALCEKYGVTEWREFVPLALQKNVPGPLKHETTYTDDFNRADAATLGASWSNIVSAGSQELGISTNNCRLPSSGNTSATISILHRYDSDVSSTDHECSVSWVSDSFNLASGNGTVGTLVRKDSSSTLTFYTGRLNRTGNGTSYTANNSQLFKFVSGTPTQLGSDVSVTPSLPDPIKTYCSGSTIKNYYDGVEKHSQTDTAITSGVRGGIRCNTLSGVAWRGDDWSIADLAASGLLLTQLERGVRGLNRGTYTKW